MLLAQRRRRRVDDTKTGRPNYLHGHDDYNVFFILLTIYLQTHSACTATTTTSRRHQNREAKLLAWPRRLQCQNKEERVETCQHLNSLVVLFMLIHFYPTFNIKKLYIFRLFQVEKKNVIYNNQPKKKVRKKVQKNAKNALFMYKSG